MPSAFFAVWRVVNVFPLESFTSIIPLPSSTSVTFPHEFTNVILSPGETLVNVVLLKPYAFNVTVLFLELVVAPNAITRGPDELYALVFVREPPSISIVPLGRVDVLNVKLVPVLTTISLPEDMVVCCNSTDPLLSKITMPENVISLSADEGVPVTVVVVCADPTVPPLCGTSLQLIVCVLAII
ncbi:hypothetical protein AA11825_0033 [Acetobacter pomorum DSM 11825]|nr:hypothetical protein AA11825_0033 [Acetobacter pomorum DSM 11825]